VAPGDFDLPQGSEAWVTYGANTPDLLEEDGWATLDLVGRLRPGRTMEEGRRELDRLVTEIDGSQWSADARLRMTVRPLADVVVGQVRPAVWVLGAAAVLVFLVAVLNLGNLLLVRGLERQREFAIRRAIGATRASLARQVVVESALLVLLGGATGTALAWVAWRVLPVVAPADFPRLAGIAPNAVVLLIALALGFLAVAIVSGLPALSLREIDLQVSRGADPGSAAAGSGRLAWSGAIAAQVTLAVVTLIASLLLVRTLAYLERLEPGFEVDDLGMAQIAMLTIGRDTTLDGEQLVERLVERLSAVPGVSSVTTALTRPLSGTGGWDFAFMTEGQTDAQAANNPYVNYESARPNYFTTLGLPILRGRAFEESDREGSPLVVIVSQSLARLVWPGQDPIGKRLRWPGEEEADNWRTVIGVAADARYREFLEPRLTVYLPARQPTGPWGPGYVLIRTERPFATLVPSLRQAAREVHLDLDLVNDAPLESVLDQPLARPRFNAGVLLLFSSIAVTLTAVGLYGLTSFVVVQRRREVGIRLALGAESRQIVGLFLRRGMAPVLAGAAAGVVIALAGTRVLASVLHGVGPTDPTAFVAAVAGFTLIALAAILVATRRAAATDPSIALRTD
jgi:putative ABC transport system permease protein